MRTTAEISLTPLGRSTIENLRRDTQRRRTATGGVTITAAGGFTRAGGVITAGTEVSTTKVLDAGV